MPEGLFGVLAAGTSSVQGSFLCPSEELVAIGVEFLATLTLSISKKFILHPIHLMHQMQGMHKRQTDVQDAKCKTSCVLTSSRRGYMKPLRPVLLPRLSFAS